MSDKLHELETHVIRAGLSILAIIGFAAFFVRELWRIIETFLRP